MKSNVRIQLFYLNFCKKLIIFLELFLENDYFLMILYNKNKIRNEKIKISDREKKIIKNYLTSIFFFSFSSNSFLGRSSFNIPLSSVASILSSSIFSGNLKVR